MSGENDLDDMMKKVNEFKNDINHHDKNIERIMSRYNIGVKKKSKKKITADKFLKDFQKGKIPVKSHKSCYDLIKDVRKELRQKTLEKLGKKEKKNKRGKVKRTPPQYAEEDNQSTLSNASSRSRKRFEMLKKKRKRKPSPKLQSLKLAYHSPSIDEKKPPLSNSEIQKSQDDGYIRIKEASKVSFKSEIIFHEMERSENQIWTQEPTKREGWEEEIVSNQEASHGKISFLTQNRRSTLRPKENEDSLILNYSAETSQIGVVQPGNRLSTIKDSKKMQNLKKLKNLLTKKKKLENEIFKLFC